ncbi:MAG: SDR family oxidoreductase [Bdellovibrionales bacterium]|nr:SDR family oxidoreductase [Oligoflexia bacterium]
MLNDAVILITGAGKGIGEAVVIELLERKTQFPGLKLFLTSRTLADLEKLSLKAAESGIPCEFLAQDLAADPLAAVQACVAKFGRIDSLIHSAGVGRFGDFLELSTDDLKYVIQNNIEATFILLQAAYRQMKSQIPAKTLRGQIQCITSVAAEKPFPQSSIYCMSKFAQRGLLEVMRHFAHQDRIRILEIQPGATFTPMWGEVSAEMKAKMMEPRDIAGPMVDALLLSEKASLEVLTLRPLAGDL